MMDNPDISSSSSKYSLFGHYRTTVPAASSWSSSSSYKNHQGSWCQRRTAMEDDKILWPSKLHDRSGKMLGRQALSASERQPKVTSTFETDQIHTATFPKPTASSTFPKSSESDIK